jgi:tellurite resistance-related uncharacterized protein
MIKIRPWGHEEKLFSINRKWIMNEQYETAVHQHSVDELLLVDSGIIIIELGDSSENLDSIFFIDENSKIVIPANKWHKIIVLSDSVVFDFSRRDDDNIIKKENSVGRKLTDNEFKKYLELYLKKQHNNTRKSWGNF